MIQSKWAIFILIFLISILSDAHECQNLPGRDAFRKALIDARKEKNGGLDLDMWGTLVDRGGIICSIVFTGKEEGEQWPGSRLISAEKAYTANSYSLPTLALSTANLYVGSQPGGFLYGLKETNPVNVAIAYKGERVDFGSVKDPLIGDRIGGQVVFGGGLALYNEKKEIVGGLGVSGDTSCADHNIAWRTRQALTLDYVSKGVGPDKNDQIIYDLTLGKSRSGYGHPKCGGTEDKIAKGLPKTRSTTKTAQNRRRPKKIAQRS